jgi:magnesium chelatase family protein
MPRRLTVLQAWPQRKITVGLSPASLPKRGSWFDLAICYALLPVMV